MANFKQLRDNLTQTDIINILRKYDIEPVYVRDSYLIFPTCCHNLVGGSPKLYYYSNTHLFHCFTDCNSSFDIFDLIIKMEKIRGREIGKIEAIKKAGLDIPEYEFDSLAEESLLGDISHLVEINKTNIYDVDDSNLEPLDISFLDNRFSFDLAALKTWVDEGISLNTMLKYRITYDPIDNCIIIPQFEDKGKVVGVRGRYLDIDAKDKYKPIVFNGKLLAHPLSKTLYGYYHNRSAIAQTKTAIIFESEKSVLKMDTIYDRNNISVAVCGQNITREQIQLLINIGVSNVVLAFDADYRNYDEFGVVYEKYRQIGLPLTTYFNVTIVVDDDMNNRLLGYKDSPIDRGAEVFNKLMRKRKVLR